jgi:hypothetical protein
MGESNHHIIILMIVIFISYVRPVILTNFFNSNIGRILLIISIVLATSLNTMYGIYGVILLISFREGAKKEGLDNMENNKTEDKKNTKSVDDWKKKHCKLNKVILDNKEVPLDQVSKKFPDIEFEKDECNPCSQDCKFKIKVTSSKSRLDIEDKVRSKASGSIATEK